VLFAKYYYGDQSRMRRLTGHVAHMAEMREMNTEF